MLRQPEWRRNSPIPRDGIPNLTYNTTSNRITTAGFEYDAAGNQTRALSEDGVTWLRYEYDAANRLQVVKKDDGTYLQAFQFGSTNARLMDMDYQYGYVKMIASNGGTTLAEYTEFAQAVMTWTKSYIYLGDSQLSTISKAGSSEITEFNHPDRLGTRVITNQVAGTSYEQNTLPFGTALNAESTTSLSKRFTSYERSARTGLDYAVNRTYDSKLGRFTQVDPIGMKAVSLSAPQTLNLYNYCGNDPINHTDPSGLFWGAIGRFFKKAWKWIAIAVVVALVVVAIVASQGAAAPGFLHVLGAFFSKLGIASFISGEAYGFTLGASGIGLITAAGVGAVANQFTRKKGGGCGGPGEPPCEDENILRIEIRASRWNIIATTLFGAIIAQSVIETLARLRNNSTCLKTIQAMSSENPINVLDTLMVNGNVTHLEGMKIAVAAAPRELGSKGFIVLGDRFFQKSVGGLAKKFGLNSLRACLKSLRQ